MIALRPSRVGVIAMNQPGSASSKTTASSLCSGAEAMQHHPPGAMVLVLRDIEKGAEIARPHGFAGGVLDEVGQGRRPPATSRTQIAYISEPLSSALQANFR